jgi:hypothetical protein
MDEQKNICLQYDNNEGNQQKLTESKIASNIQEHFGITGKKNLLNRDPVDNAGGIFHMVKNVIVRFGINLIELSQKMEVENDAVLHFLYGENSVWTKVKRKTSPN